MLAWGEIPADSLLDDRFDLVAEPSASEPLRMAADHDGIEGTVDCAPNGVGKRLGSSLVDEKARLIRRDGFEGPASRIRDNRPAARLGLERDDAKVLFSRKDDDSGVPIQLTNLLVALTPKKLDVIASSRSASAGTALEPVPIGSVSDNFRGASVHAP